MDTKIKKFTKETILNIYAIERDFPEFDTGDTIRVSIKIKEGTKERIQDFEGIVIYVKGKGVGKNFSVRKITEGISVERSFPFCTPIISEIKVIQKGVVRRAKLYYMRTRFGKQNVIKRKNKKVTSLVNKLAKSDSSSVNV